MHNHGHEEKVEEEEGCEEVIRIPFDTCENPKWGSAKAAGRKSGRFTFGWGFVFRLSRSLNLPMSFLNPPKWQPSRRKLSSGIQRAIYTQEQCFRAARRGKFSETRIT